VKNAVTFATSAQSRSSARTICKWFWLHNYTLWSHIRTVLLSPGFYVALYVESCLLCSVAVCLQLNCCGLTRSPPSLFFPGCHPPLGLSFAEVPVGYLLWCRCTAELHVLSEWCINWWDNSSVGPTVFRGKFWQIPCAISWNSAAHRGKIVQIPHLVTA